MKTKHLLVAAAAFLGLAMSSCSPFALVNSETYNNANLTSFRTFRIVTPDDGSLPPGMEAVTYYNIAAAIREQMVERGYVESPDSPIVVNIGLTVKKEIQTEPLAAALPPAPAPVPPPPGPMGPHFYPYPGPGPAPAYAPYFMMPRSYYWSGAYNPNAQVITGIYREGVLTMDIVNMQTKEALFSASVATILQPGDSQFRNLSGIAEAVQTLFSKYPVPLLPQYQKQK